MVFRKLTPARVYELYYAGYYSPTVLLSVNLILEKYWGTSFLTVDMMVRLPPGIYGWFTGGYIGSGTIVNIIDRITLADDTTNAIDRCDLTIARYGTSAFTDLTYGWFGGGYATISYDIVDRITLADDTTNAIDRCDLTVGRSRLAGFTG